jgi:hypothetical protein
VHEVGHPAPVRGRSHEDAADAAVSRLARRAPRFGPLLGDGTARRVVTRDPEGVWLELRERTPGIGPSEVHRPA